MTRGEVNSPDYGPLLNAERLATGAAQPSPKTSQLLENERSYTGDVKRGTFVRVRLKPMQFHKGHFLNVSCR